MNSINNSPKKRAIAYSESHIEWGRDSLLSDSGEATAGQQKPPEESPSYKIPSDKQQKLHIREVVATPVTSVFFAEKCYIFIIKSSIHLFLISVFETIFFFTYVSGQEDSGIENTINTYYTPIKNSCPSWGNATKWIIYEILSNGQEIEKIRRDGIYAFNLRATGNRKLLYDSLIVSAGFLGILILVTGGVVYKKIKIKLYKTVLENITMVFLLGIYEYIFFKLIIYNYATISTSELNSYIAGGIYDCVSGGR